MALTESTMLSLDSAAPDFALPEVISGNIIRLDDFRGTTNALVVMFIQGLQHGALPASETTLARPSAGLFSEGPVEEITPEQADTCNKCPSPLAVWGGHPRELITAPRARDISAGATRIRH